MGRQINRLSYIKDLNFNFFQISCHLNALVRPSGQGGSVPYPPMPHELIVWPGHGRGFGLRLGVATLQKLCHELKFFSATPQQQEEEEEAQTSDAKDDAIL